MPTRDRAIPVIGVGSALPNGRHVHMWDFDAVPLHNVVQALRVIQWRESMGPIHVIHSSPGDNYQAVCLQTATRFDAMRRVSDTAYVDPRFVRWMNARGWATLRLSVKKRGMRQHQERLLAGQRGANTQQEHVGLSRLFGANVKHWSSPPSQDTLRRDVGSPDHQIFLEGYKTIHLGPQHDEAWRCPRAA